MRNIAVFSGSSHPELTTRICNHLGIQPGHCSLGKFKNGESNIQILQSVRDLDVYIVQTSSGKVNDALMELLIMVSACKMASAAKVTAVLPLFPYARQPDVPYRNWRHPYREMQEGAPPLRSVSSASLEIVPISPLQQEVDKQPTYKQWQARSGTLIANMLMVCLFL